ncbi:MAG: hypothetical protein MI861_20175 [Pirellulales bacterium]|nr:hypothetical protein [Pirellulales bacterium]
MAGFRGSSVRLELNQHPRPRAFEQPPLVNSPLRLCAAFTVPELLMVLSIIGALGVVVLPRLTRQAEQASRTVTVASMAELRRAVMTHYRADMYESLPYPSDPARQGHPQLHYLFIHPQGYTTPDPSDDIRWTYDASTMRGWSGPYLNESQAYAIDAARGFTNLYGQQGDRTPIDGWGNPIVLQQPVLDGSVASATSVQYARFVSAGRDGVMQTPPGVLQPTVTQMGDDIVLYLRAR